MRDIAALKEANQEQYSHSPAQGGAQGGNAARPSDNSDATEAAASKGSGKLSRAEFLWQTSSRLEVRQAMGPE